MLYAGLGCLDCDGFFVCDGHITAGMDREGFMYAGHQLGNPVGDHRIWHYKMLWRSRWERLTSLLITRT